MKRRSTKSALLMSAISLLLCVSMLIGSTFAWFTDSVTSANNIIKSGNLDIELEYWKNDKWVDVKGASDILTNQLWEPGVTEVAYLRVANAGNLALKYQLGINIISETKGMNVAGEEFKLSDYIQFGVKEINADPTTKAPVKYATREAAVEDLDEVKKISAGYTQPGSMQPEKEFYLALVVFMPTTVGNEANYREVAPQIDLGINVFATQFTYEKDSFNEFYDKGAPWTGTVDYNWYLDDPDAAEYVLTSADELAGLAAIVNGTATPTTTYSLRAAAAPIKDDFKGQTIKLGGNIDLRDLAWTPIGDNANPFLGNFDGQGHTISNLYVSNEGWSGLIGHAGLGSAVTIKNVTIDGVTILSNRMAGAVVGQLYGSIDNCHVKNAEIMATPNLDGDKYDNGDKVGGIVGWLGDNDQNRTLTNCSADNVKLGAYRDVGGIVGYVASSTTVENNTATKVSVTVDQTTNYYGDKDVNAGAVIGRVNGTITENNNAVDTESAVNATYAKDGLTLKSDDKGNVVLYKVPETYAGTTVNVPEGVTTIGGYAFAYNAAIDKIVLPSTVTTLADRAFRDTSASVVVLNEGLTNISYQAFRNAANVTEVVIPSTVTTIAKEAFQNSGITTLTIPASVTTLEYGACRDMKELTSVVIDGNVDIPVYAFRACAKLESVTINGEDVTFGGGSRGMIFTNTENGDGSAITVTVRNDVVKERLLAADTAAKDYGGYTIIVDDGSIKVETPEALVEKLEEAQPGTIIDATNVEIPTTGSTTDCVTIPAGVTLRGATVSAASQGYLVVEGTGEDVVFEECNFDGPGFGMFVIAGNEENGANVVYENCTFEGQVAPNFVNNPNGTSTFNNCTFKLGSDGIGLVNCMGGTHTFNNCVFDYTGGATFGSNQYVRWNAVNSYSERYSTAVILNGCTFKNCGTQRYGSNSSLTIK